MNAPVRFDDPALPRHDWTLAEVRGAVRSAVHRAGVPGRRSPPALVRPAEVQLSQLLSVKTGGCPEDCGYCSQSAKFDTGVKASKLMEPEAVVAAAARAKAGGAQRFCMGAAWRDLKDRDLPKVAAMIAGVKALGLETCATLGMLEPDQAEALKAAGLDYYNHNLDTGPEYYDDGGHHPHLPGPAGHAGGRARRRASRSAAAASSAWARRARDRAGLLHALATLPEHPESLPINALVPITGTPLGRDCEPIDGLEFVRTIAVARLVCPKSVVRLSAGREHDEPRAAGAVLPGGRQLDLRRRGC